MRQTIHTYPSEGVTVPIGNGVQQLRIDVFEIPRHIILGFLLQIRTFR